MTPMCVIMCNVAFDEREPSTKPYTWARLHEHAAIVKRCEEMGGVVLRPPKQTGFKAPPRDPEKPE